LIRYDGFSKLGVSMKRREFLGALGSAAVTWPATVRAQHSERMRRIGWLDPAPENDPGVQARIGTVRQELERAGWTIGRNLEIDYRWGTSDIERARSASLELLSRSPDVILCAASPAVVALLELTRTTPIVFVAVAEPVEQGFVQSLAHPGGNTTGFSYLEPTVGAKWLELLKEIAPRIKRVAYVFGSKVSPYAPLFYKSIEAAGEKLSVDTIVAPAEQPGELDPIISRFGTENGVIFNADAFVLTNRLEAINLAARYRVPAIYGIPTTAAEGGLMYYRLDLLDLYRQSVAYIDRILKGEKPADLPVQQPTKFNFEINLKTAKALGLTVPNTLLVSADKVIE
jgi:putative tryptophan/tyrosine transport system substrate-binding protein